MKKMKSIDKSNTSLYKYKITNQQMIDYNIHYLHLTSKPIFDMHLQAELGVVLSGRTARYSRGAYNELPRGGVWLAGMLEPHGRQALEENTKVAVFIINMDFLYLTDIPNVDIRLWQVPFSTPAEHRPLMIGEEFAEQVEHLEHLLTVNSDPAMQATQIKLTLLEILLHVNRIGTFSPSNNGICPDINDIWMLRPAFELIYKSSRPVNTNEAAKLCKLTPPHFSKLFIQVTNSSFRKFFLRHRLNQVAHELKNSNSSLDELSEKWGFATKSHLLNRFKEHYKVTPAVYRNLSMKLKD